MQSFTRSANSGSRSSPRSFGNQRCSKPLPSRCRPPLTLPGYSSSPEQQQRQQQHRLSSLGSSPGKQRRLSSLGSSPSTQRRLSSLGSSPSTQRRLSSLGISPSTQCLPT